eukprot:scaffold1369_cov396-Prasinococcus_capsulatus_cf.AAC.6
MGPHACRSENKLSKEHSKWKTCEEVGAQWVTDPMRRLTLGHVWSLQVGEGSSLEAHARDDRSRGPTGTLQARREHHSPLAHLLGRVCSCQGHGPSEQGGQYPERLARTIGTAHSMKATQPRRRPRISEAC